MFTFMTDTPYNECMNFGDFRNLSDNALFLQKKNNPMYEKLQKVILDSSVIGSSALLCPTHKNAQLTSIRYNFARENNSNFNVHIDVSKPLRVNLEKSGRIPGFTNSCVEIAEAVDNSFLSTHSEFMTYLKNNSLISSVNGDYGNTPDTYLYLLRWSHDGLFLTYDEKCEFPMFEITLEGKQNYTISGSFGIRLTSTKSEYALYESSAFAIGFSSKVFFKGNNAIDISLQIIQKLHQMKVNSKYILYAPKDVYNHLLHHSLIKVEKDTSILSFVKVIPFSPA